MKEKLKLKLKQIKQKLHEEKLGIIETYGYYPIEKAREEKLAIRDRYIKQMDNIRADFNQQIHDLELEHKAEIKLKDKVQRELEETIKKLKKDNSNISNEINSLQEEIESLKAKMSTMYTLEEIRSRKPRRTQTMSVRKSNIVRSNIARNSVKDLEEVE